MALSFHSAALSFAGNVAPVTQRAGAVSMETIDDLKTMAPKLNPIVGYWNPLSLGETSLGSSYDTEAAIGYLRHSEIKHGRIAMAAFVGFIVQSNGIHFPWDIANGISYASISAAGGPAAQWDAIPTAGKLQIFATIFFLELWGEGSTTLAADGQKHYMRGGKPGYYPTFDLFRDNVHPLPLNLFASPLAKGRSAEKKEKGLLVEINNGRAAMIGIMAFMSEAKVPGSVPGLSSVGIAPYSGECMAPFSASDSLPFVQDMLAFGNGGYF